MARPGTPGSVLAAVALAAALAVGGTARAAAPPPASRTTVADVRVEPAHLPGGRGGRFTLSFTVRGAPRGPLRWQVVVETRDLSAAPPRLEVKPWAGEARDGERVEVPCEVGAGGWGAMTLEVRVLNGEEDWSERGAAVLVLDPPENLRLPE